MSLGTINGKIVNGAIPILGTITINGGTIYYGYDAPYIRLCDTRGNGTYGNSPSANPSTADATSAWNNAGVWVNLGDHVYNPPGTIYSTSSSPVLGKFTGAGVTGGSLDVRDKVSITMPSADTVTYAHDITNKKLIMVSSTGAVRYCDYPALAVPSDPQVKAAWVNAPPYSQSVTYTETPPPPPPPVAPPPPPAGGGGATGGGATGGGATGGGATGGGATGGGATGGPVPIPTTGPPVSNPVQSDNTVTYVIVGVVVLAILGGGAYFMMGSSAKAAAKPAVAKKKGGHFDIGD
jgi:hypothetical protein